MFEEKRIDTRDAPPASLFAETNSREADQFRARLNKLIRSARNETMTITPAKADVMLERNKGNRPINLRRAQNYAKQMADGKWMLNGQAIVFSREGALNDGQHRLTACIISGMPFVSDVRFGIEREAFMVTDIHGARTAGHMFHIAGIPNYNVAASAARLLLMYETGTLLTNGGTVDTSPTALREVLEANPELHNSVSAGMAVYRQGKLLSSSVAAILHFLFSCIEADLADAFMDQLGNGLGLTRRTDPIAKLRERLIENKAAKAKLPVVDIMAITIKAWNKYRRGKTIQSLVWRSRGDAPEPFPVAR